jgi:hypothetical protein
MPIAALVPAIGAIHRADVLLYGTRGGAWARIDGSPLTAAAGLAWSGDLPRLLQQVLFDTADSIVV